jgi:hypothetical protein
LVCENDHIPLLRLGRGKSNCLSLRFVQNEADVFSLHAYLIIITTTVIIIITVIIITIIIIITSVTIIIGSSAYQITVYLS